MRKTLFLRFSLSLFSCVSLILASGLIASAADATKHTFESARKPGQVDHVAAKLEVGGDTKFTDDDKKLKHEKMSVVCALDYVEKTLALPDDAGVARSIRDYKKASATVKVGDGQFEPTLAPEHRLIAVESGKQSTLLFSPGGNLTRDELDAIDVQGDSLLFDRLLPVKPVAIGDDWRQPISLMAALLGLDEAAKSSVRSELLEVRAGATPAALFSIHGEVEGAAYGVPSKIVVRGKFRFDLRNKRVDWLGLLIKEDRQSSFVADGVDAASRLQVTVGAADEPPGLADDAIEKLDLKPTPEATYLAYASPAGDWKCRYDRRWHVHHERPKNSAVVLRFLDRGMFVGHCNLSSLPRIKPDKLIAFDDFQKEVREALGKSFGEFVEAGASTNEAGYQVYRVVARGASSDLPMQWTYYLVTDRDGRQAALTFAVEQKLLEQFADADKPIVESLRFVEK